MKKNQKFDLSTYVVVDNTLFLQIMMPLNINLVFEHAKSTFRKRSR